MHTPLGIGFLGYPDLRTMAEAGRHAEAAGFESAWVAETRITRDAVTGMTALLLGTERLRVGSAAINVFTRGAALTAVTWSTMAEAAPGRVMLGIGAGSPATLAQQGYRVERPLARLRAFVEAMRAAWGAAIPVTYDGPYTRFEGLTPEVRPASPPPIYFCVSGPRALACAALMADGVVLDAFLPPAYVRQARSLLDGAAAGRYLGEVAGILMVSVAHSVAEATTRLRPLLATYLLHFPELARQTGLDPEFLERLRARADAGGLEAAGADLSEAVVARYSVCGPPAACKDRLDEYRAAGLQLPILCPEPSSLGDTIRHLARA